MSYFFFISSTTTAQEDELSISLQVQGGVLYNFAPTPNEFSTKYMNIGSILSTEKREVGLEMEAYQYESSEFVTRFNSDSLFSIDTVGGYNITQSHVQLSSFWGKDRLKNPTIKLVIAPMVNFFFRNKKYTPSTTIPNSTSLFPKQENNFGLGLGFYPYAVFSPSAFKNKLAFVGGFKLTLVEFGYGRSTTEDPTALPRNRSFDYPIFDILRKEIPFSIGIRYKLQ